MPTAALFRIAVSGAGVRLAAGTVEHGPSRLLPESATVGDLLQSVDALAQAVGEGAGEHPPAGSRVLTPIDRQEVWASGVTYARSREARRLESGHADAYELVYDADRPELFLKSPPGDARGPGEPVGIRADSKWNVPEPELAVAFDAAGHAVAYTVGNDISSRSIEAENPLYLPQAKIYDGSLALGPCLVPVSAAPGLDAMEIAVVVAREGKSVFDGAIAVTAMKRSIGELGSWLFRARSFPQGVVLLTGTGIVPPDTFTLEPGDHVSITITGLGTLANVVELIGAPSAPRPQ